MTNTDPDGTDDGGLGGPSFGADMRPDVEQANARLEALLEDDREQHSLELTGLTNKDVFLLLSVIPRGAEDIAEQGAVDDAYRVMDLHNELRDDAADLIEKLDDIEGVFREAAQTNGLGARVGPLTIRERTLFAIINVALGLSIVVNLGFVILAVPLLTNQIQALAAVACAFVLALNLTRGGL